MTVTARRGTITDRNGVELAVSEDAITVFANPFLIEEPGDGAAQLAPLLGMPEDELLEKLSDREPGFVYLARKLTLSRAQGPEARRSRASAPSTEPRAAIRRARWPRRCSAAWAPTTTGSAGLEQSRDEDAARQRRQAPDREGRPRRAGQHRRVEARRGRRGPAAHDRRRDPGAHRGGAGRGGADLPAEGRDRARARPAQRRDPRARQLAARGRQRPRRIARLGTPGPLGGSRPTSRARPSRRSRCRARSQEGLISPTRRSTCRRDPGGRPA